MDVCTAISSRPISRVVVIAVACVFAAIGPALAADMPARPNSLPGCDSATYEQATVTGHRVVAANPKTAVFTDYIGDEAVKLAAAINASPPRSNYHAEHVLVIEMPVDEEILVMIGIVHEGCVVLTAEVRQETWSQLLHSALGDAL